MTFLASHIEKFSYSPKIKMFEMMILFGGADYSYRYRLQTIVLIIGLDYAYIWPMYRYSSSLDTYDKLNIL